MGTGTILSFVAMNFLVVSGPALPVTDWGAPDRRLRHIDALYLTSCGRSVPTGRDSPGRS
jgi:hypothetical protein